MKTISKNVLLRLAAQADEADIWGDERIAENLTKQVQKYAENRTRVDEENYEYSKEELEEDLESMFWDAAVRIFDYYDETPDAKQIQEIVDSEVESFIGVIESLIHKDIGPYEPATPGEVKEVSEDEDESVIEEKSFDLESDDEDDEDMEYEYDSSEDDDDDEDDKE